MEPNRQGTLPRRRRFAPILATLLLVLAAPALAETIELRSGRVLRGEIVEETETKIAVRIGAGVIWVERRDLAAKEVAEHPVHRFADDLAALKSGDSGGAYRISQQAARAGAFDVEALALARAVEWAREGDPMLPEARRLLALAQALPGNPDLERSLDRAIPGTHSKSTTPHWFLVHNSTATHARETEQGLERVWRAFHQLTSQLQVTLEPPESRLLVAVYSNHAQWLAAATDEPATIAHAVGVYRFDTRRVMLYDTRTMPQLGEFRKLLRELKDDAIRRRKAGNELVRDLSRTRQKLSISLHHSKTVDRKQIDSLLAAARTMRETETERSTWLRARAAGLAAQARYVALGLQGETARATRAAITQSLAEVEEEREARTALLAALREYERSMGRLRGRTSNMSADRIGDLLEGAVEFEKVATQQNRAVLRRAEQIADTLRQLHQSVAETNRTTPQHEAAHQLSHVTGLLGPEDPLWIHEGLAQMFEGARFQHGWWRLADGDQFRHTCGTFKTVSGARLSSVISQRTFVNNTLLAYEQSHLLVHYLINRRPDALRAFLTRPRPAGGKDRYGSGAVSSFRKHFGALDELEADLTKYASGL